MITKKRFAPILILNVGSSSIKYATFDEKLKELDRNSVTDISKLPQILDSKFDIPSIIGHRIVHGGQKYVQPTKLTPEVMADLQEVSKLAPLHNPPALKVAQQIIKKWPAVENWAVFDTAFFANLPIYAKLYALPFELSEKYQIIRYGFHGISHRWVAQQAAKKLNQDLAKLKVITVHLGAGCSIAAIEDGQPIDTSMGFTPLEGLVMATRCGDIDPAVVGFLQREAEMSWDQIEKMLNEESGLFTSLKMWKKIIYIIKLRV